MVVGKIGMGVGDGRTAEGTVKADEVGVEHVSASRSLSSQKHQHLSSREGGSETTNLPPLSDTVVLLEESLVVRHAVLAVDPAR